MLGIAQRLDSRQVGGSVNWLQNKPFGCLTLQSFHRFALHLFFCCRDPSLRIVCSNISKRDESKFQQDTKSCIDTGNNFNKRERLEQRIHENYRCLRGIERARDAKCRSFE